MVCIGSHFLIHVLLFLVVLISHFKTAAASIVRGLKKDVPKSNEGSNKSDSTVVTFEKCAELIPSVPPDPNLAAIFELEETCTTSFWENQAPWTNGSPAYTAYYPVCSCVILAKGCFLPVVSTFAPMYDVARSTGMDLSKQESIDFANPFIEKDCLAYALAFLDQWRNEPNEEPPSND